MTTKIYVDGGCICSNPSPYGGTWAYVVVVDGKKVFELSEYVTPEDIGTHKFVTNNQMELYAVIQAFQYMMSDDVITLLSDSEVTLGRVFKNYALNNIPFPLVYELERQKERLTNFKKIKYVLLAGHPSRVSLKKGTDKKGRPVSIWNVLCDELCKQQAEKYVSTYLKP